MGTWHYDVFDDDIAYDFFPEIDTNAKKFFRSTFLKAIQSSYLEYDDGIAVTVSAAYIDNHINGTQYRTDNYEATDVTNVNLFQQLRPVLVLDELTDLAVQALEKVISDKSELNELWSGNIELYAKWKSNIEQLINRLLKST